MTTHTWSNIPQENTADGVMWRCSVCGMSCGFAREGFGEPSADETAYPDNIDDYVGVCTGIAAAIGLEPRAPMTKFEFLAKVTDQELAACLAARISNPAVAVLFYRLEQAQEVLIDDPQTLEGLKYLESAGLLSVGRADAIVARAVLTQ